jgi:hypothetical protein
MFSQLSILISMLSEVLLLRYGRINEQGLPVSWRVCRWVKGFAGELKGLPVSWRVCRWVQGTIRTGGHRKGCHRRCAAQRVCQRVEGFANALKGLPPWRSFSPPEKKLVFHDLPETGLPWLPPDPHSRYFPTELIFSYGFVIFWRASTST